MKLADHLIEEGMSSGPVNKTPGSYTILHEDVKDLHVIGTCGECEYWDPKEVELEGWGNCDSYKVAAHTHDTDAKRHEDHGCIHWGKKDV